MAVGQTREELSNEMTALKRPTEVLLQDLSKLYKLSQNNNNKRFDSIYHFLHDTRLLYLAFEKIKTNSGILTPGSDGRWPDIRRILNRYNIKNILAN